MVVQGLSGLPVELVQQIAIHFTCQEHAAVRATCKWLDAALLESWGKKYASRMQVMRMEFSLQALVDLSKSRLSPYLKHVVISMEELPAIRSWHSDKLEIYAREQSRFVQAGADLEMLQKAFFNLQLETVEVHSYYKYEPQAPWTTYGRRKVMEDLRLDLSKEKPPVNFDTTLASTLPGVLFALGRSGARPKRFEVSLASGSLPDGAFIILNHMKELITSVLSSLESLSLPVRFSDRAPGTGRLPAENPNSSTYNFRRFLRCLEGSSLRRLKLDISGGQSPEAEAFFQWLGTTPETTIPGRQLLSVGVGPSRPRAMPPPISFEHLEELELLNLCIGRAALTLVLRKIQPSLRSLRLQRVCLDDPRNSGSRYSASFGDEVWTVFLWSLISIGCGDTLRTISLQQLSYLKGSSKREVSFPHEYEGFRSSYEYSGTNMCGALEGIAGQLYPYDDLDVFQ
ncbi:hypothetical protein BKA67DRAFT_559482 [Truncatella angustata]|uniref:F-box domain-containing protein n=1 Tax=Truncatella angustata TaxID=152316 RepID=A0A9P8ZXN5_9PEZI|nr:uncharacterized protein BKA67DRAFT_559482 [Truncatella angustata]KAH6655101.1 hypothetical protein BKA67DRAFT_559482 [Truncatella angustata]KAH8198227.1 hypothetical protein TruAng_007611 [Truncatella angustata]